MAKILIVEDDVSLANVLRDRLSAEHHSVESAGEGRVALDLLVTYQYDVVVLDLTLPDMDGLELCQQYRSRGGSARILMLTGRDRVEQIESGLGVGADDYLTKPFHVTELLARIRALMRRERVHHVAEIKMGSLVIQPKLFCVTRGDEELKLTPTEFALLEFLIRHPGEVFSSEALLEMIWRSNAEVSTATVKSYMHRLRERLGSGPGIPSIVTVHGVGYRLEPPAK